MALYAFDGTGNQDEDLDGFDTNVLKFFEAYDDPLKNTDPDEERGSLYLKGLGRTSRTFLGDTLNEAFGIGGHRRVRQALRRLRHNLRSGDDIIDIVAFSRGAGLALSFANEVAGDVPNVQIRFMGLWEAVGQFGLPGERLQAGHDLSVPRNVRRCYHAMALDEQRPLFPLTRLLRDDHPVDGFVEAWFRGTHSDVGGGNANGGLNWIPLHWMYKAAQREGLPILQSAIDANLANRDVVPRVSQHRVAAGARRQILPTDLLHISVGEGGETTHSIAELAGLSRIDDQGQVLQSVHGSPPTS